MRETGRKYFFKLENKDLDYTVNRLSELKNKLSLCEKFYGERIYKSTIEPNVFKFFLKSKKCLSIDINSSIRRTVKFFNLEVLEYIALLINKKVLSSKGNCLKSNILVTITENGNKLFDYDNALVKISYNN